MNLRLQHRAHDPLRPGFLVFAVAAAAAIGGLLVLPSVAAVMAPAVLLAGLLTVGVAGMARGRFKMERGWLLRVTGVSFSLHAILGFAILHSASLTRALGPDALFYNETAIELLSHWRGESAIPARVVEGKSGFVYLLAATYQVFGAYAEAGIVINAALSAALIPLVWDTTRRLYGQRAARISAILAALLPGMLIWTSQLLREALALFLLALAANAAVRLTERRGFASMVVLGSAVALLFTVRANVALLTAGGLVIGLALGQRNAIAGATVGGVSLAAILAIVLGLGIGYRGYQFVVNSNLQDVSETRQLLATNAETGIGEQQDVSTPARALRYLPQGLALLVAGPYPWQPRSFLQAAGVVDAAAMWVLLPSLWRGWRLSRRRRYRQPLVLVMPAIFVALGLSLLVGNIGMAVRERTQVVVLLLPLIAYGWAARRSRPADLPVTSATSATRSSGG